MNPILIDGVELLGRGIDRDSFHSVEPRVRLTTQNTTEFGIGTELVILRPGDLESVGQLGSERALYRSYSGLDLLAERIKRET